MKTQRSVTGGQHSFAKIPSAEIQRSQFDRSCGVKTTFDAGQLIPIFCDEALPGDTMNLKMSTFARLATPLHPIMDNLYMDFHFFSVPNRLLWENWEKFMGAQTNPLDSTDFLTPISTTLAGSGAFVGSLDDYLGIPTGIPDLEHTAFYHRAYNLIYNEWYRDENLTNSRVVDQGDGPDNKSLYVIMNRNKRHDYFTSCLPWPQKGDSVLLPLGDTAPLIFPGELAITATGDGVPIFDWDGGGTGALNSSNDETVHVDGTLSGTDLDGGWDQTKLAVTQAALETGVADLSTATAATINTLRTAFQIQRLYERDARGGTRYTEILRSHFGVVSPDQRLQRPEYLGGGTANINVNPIAQTSETDLNTPQGNLAAFGTSSSSGIGFNKSFVEHCVIIGLVSVRADLNYQQGLSRTFSRRTRWDYFWPALAHLGEQAVLNKEIYAQNDANDDLVFGYQERFAEYRYKPSNITGQFRSTYTTPLDTWHLAQEFEDLPILSHAFMAEDPPIDRVIAVQTEPHILFDGFFSYKCARAMPTYSVPGMIDHF